jgi:hypothetical protein
MAKRRTLAQAASMIKNKVVEDKWFFIDDNVGIKTLTEKKKIIGFEFKFKTLHHYFVKPAQAAILKEREPFAQVTSCKSILACWKAGEVWLDKQK